MHIKMKTYPAILALTISLVILSCSSISVYSPEAYKQAVDLKVESLNLMALATMPFTDFEFLLKGKKDLAEMEALKQLGLSKVRLDKITNGIIDVITGSVIKTFL
jgi:hypothetical protein